MRDEIGRPGGSTDIPGTPSNPAKTVDAKSPELYEFGPFRLDPKERKLMRGSELVALTPKVFDTLHLLVRSSGHLLERDELIKQLWPDSFVEEGNLSNSIFALRKALGEDPQYIETIPKRGYRFVGAVRQLPGPPVGVSRVAKKPTKMVVFAVAVVIAVAAVLGLAIYRQRLFGRRSGPPIQSIAVLPLTNLSGDATQDYFADAMTDELINSLGQIRSLRVISRTSIMRYKGVRKPLPQIAHELNVDAVVEGAVTTSGSYVRITAQLVEASTDRHLWAHSYRRELREVLSLQNEIAGAIAEQIQGTLSPQEHMGPRIQRPSNPAAYESYWKGEYFLDKMTPESVKKAADYFQDAVTKEPDYVPAYNKLAAADQILGNMGALSKRESRSKAALAINKALALDPLSGPAHAQKGWVALLNDLDFTTAEAEFKRAVELSPNEVQGHQGLADYYAAVGQVDQAVLEMEHAREVDPLSFIVNVDVCRILYFARRFDEALAQCKANLNFDPKSQVTLLNIEAIFKAKGMDEDAATVFLQVAEGSGAPPDVIATLKKAQHESGLRGMCKVLVLRPKQGAERRGDLLIWASVYTCAGNKDKALELLKRAVDERSFGIVWLGVDPRYDDLRTDPRFEDLLRRMGLPQ